jgi:hypothetical protein
MAWIFIRVVISCYLCTIIIYRRGTAEELPAEIKTREGKRQNSHWNFKGLGRFRSKPHTTYVRTTKYQSNSSQGALYNQIYWQTEIKVERRLRTLK